jgi:SAM-dependent methyltransferase
VNDWLSELPPGTRVLDVASAGGSFSLDALECAVITIDEDPAAFQAITPNRSGMPWRVVGRCENLPLASSSIDLVVCNHALEHFSELHRALEEIGRVLKPSGRLYVAVPYGYGLCDDLYRWLFEGGGHVNRFRREELSRLIELRSQVRLVKWQRLYSSFGYLRGIPDLAAHCGPGLQPRLRRIGHLPRRLVNLAHQALYLGTRLVDRSVGTSSAIYGWALWFDKAGAAVSESPAFVNVCMHCGAGHPPSPERRQFRAWLCPSCGNRNRFWFK